MPIAVAMGIVVVKRGQNEKKRTSIERVGRVMFWAVLCVFRKNHS